MWLSGRIAIDILESAGAEVFAIDSFDEALAKVEAKAVACINSENSDVVSFPIN